MPKKNAPEAMDPQAEEVASPQVHTNNHRVAYSLATLISEVKEIFGEKITHVTGEPNRFNADLEVVFTADSEDTAVALDEALEVIGDAGGRITATGIDADTCEVTVWIADNPRLMDLRDSFGLAGVVAVLRDEQ